MHPDPIGLFDAGSVARRYDSGRGIDTAAYAAEDWSSTINPNPLFDTAF